MHALCPRKVKVQRLAPPPPPTHTQLRCGSSYAFSSMAALEGIHALAYGELNKLSEQNIVDCSGEAACVSDSCSYCVCVCVWVWAVASLCVYRMHYDLQFDSLFSSYCMYLSSLTVLNYYQ